MQIQVKLSPLSVLLTPLIKYSLYLGWFSVACLLQVTGEITRAETLPEKQLAVGIVQRFGGKPTDELTLKATPGDRITLEFLGGDLKTKTLTTDSVKLEINMKPLAKPIVEERVVLGTYRSFESAEDTAEKWRAKGIEVEIAHPDRWQVWAKRDIYKTPLLRRLLLQSLQAQGDKTAYIDSKILQQKPQANWVLNGFRYNRDQLKITSTQNIIEIKEGNPDKNNPKPGTLYGGSLILQPNAYGTYTLVNQVPLETYLRGVVPHEIGADAPMAAIEAQAIIARTYALRNLRRFAIDNYEMCATVDCQVYKGLNAYPSSDQAIAATKGLVLTYNNELVDALYSSTTGGITAPFTDVWNGAERPYLRAIIDSVENIWDLSKQPLVDEQNFRKFISLKKGFNESDWDVFRWQESSSLEEMTKFLKRYLQKKQGSPGNFNTIKQVQIVRRSKAGRVLQMNVTTDTGVITVDKDDIRNAFYPPISTLFYIDPIYDGNKVIKGYTFIGGGFGHGVGLSQSGSYRLAKIGWSSERILSFYYPGTQLQPLNDAIIFWRSPSIPVEKKL